MPAAKQRRGRNNKNFVAIPFEVTLALGTLADGTVIVVDSLATDFDDDIYLISLDLTAQLDNQASGEGPIHVGVAHSDFTNTEILEYLDVDPTQRDDKIAQERVKRGLLIKKVGQFPIGAVGAQQMVLNAGVPIRKKLRMLITEGFQLQLYAINRGTGATTGRVVHFSGTIYGRWIH